MPPRLITGAILAFWLAMTAWLIEREVVPLMLAEASPSYVPTLSDEIGNPIAAWTIFRDGERIGSATSKVEEMKQARIVEFRATYLFSKGPVPGLEKIESFERLSDTRKLEAVKAKFEFDKKGPLAILGTIEFEGEVKNGQIEPRILLDGMQLKTASLGKIDVPEDGSMDSTLKLYSRLRGLHEGQTWKPRSFDITQGIGKNLDKVIGGDLIKLFKAPILIAIVKSDSLHWQQMDTECYKIEYHEVGKEPSARTWVRKLDGLVLQQEISLFGNNMIFQRMMN